MKPASAFAGHNRGGAAVSDVLGNGRCVDQVVQCEGAVDQEDGSGAENSGIDQMESHGR